MARLDRFSLIACASIFALALHGCGGGGSSGGGQGSIPVEPNPPQAPAYFDSTSLPQCCWRVAQPVANELAAITHHQIVVNGTTLAYTATAGHLTARSPSSGAGGILLLRRVPLKGRVRQRGR